MSGTILAYLQVTLRIPLDTFRLCLRHKKALNGLISIFFCCMFQRNSVKLRKIISTIEAAHIITTYSFSSTQAHVRTCNTTFISRCVLYFNLSYSAVFFRSPVLHLHIRNNWDAESCYCCAQQVGRSHVANETDTWELQLLALFPHAPLMCSINTIRRQIRENLWLLFLTSFVFLSVFLGTTAWQPWYITALG